MKNSGLVVLSLGGSLIVPKSGFDLEFLRNFKEMIVEFINQGKRFVLVCGGGNTARTYQNAVREVGELTPEDVDWIGIHSTRLNAHFMRTIFRDYAHPIVVKNPTLRMEWDEQVLIAGGWKPGWSTDYCAVKLAELYDAKRVLNLSNIEYAYDSDPRTNPNAKKIEKISWADFRKIVGNVWNPGANTPFDPVASREAERIGLTVGILRGTDLEEVRKAITAEEFKGTVICR